MKLKRQLLLAFVMLTALAFIICLMYSGSLAIWNLPNAARDGIVIGYGSCMILIWMCIALEFATSKSK